MVFDTNDTNLMYAEDDFYRAEGIAFISENFVGVYGR